ncbi:Lrp/AsnC ligand binding domain-containing protein [Streptomyces cinnabarinus]|uniref:Lrp/AsnC ligand binding domain-containing protein n=1 Tax=Streptomyces cinnabarinus TaxID=67287 RepID=A0ABY7K7C6_9ACTN|nr:Lrp/AsnC ligand binding domain-containing protein [Streptomyces cinnabarinus]WAZ19182.1 Lrp/AsnC ligand binding domain-containing protein [Streptomyces cinnabarinus]
MPGKDADLILLRAGNFDYLLQVEVADLPAYEGFHANQLAALPGVATVTSYVTMKTLSATPI